MTIENDNMIPLAMLTGYLGAGKTTLLNRILNAEHGLKIAFIVHDFGSINMDSRLIVGSESETITLSNGCTCHTIKSDLITTIAQILDAETPDYIIFESSGVTDPAKVLLSFNRSILRNRVRIDTIISVVDSGQFKSMETKAERLIREQIRVSDIVILNKADLVSKETMQEARTWVEGVIDKAKIIETDHCNVPVASIIATASYNPQTAFDTSGHGVHAHNVDEFHSHEHNDRSLVFATWVWESEKQVSLAEMRRMLDTLPGSIFRAKGVMYTCEIPDKQIVLQLVGEYITLSEGDAWGDTSPKNQIVLLGDISAVDKVVLQSGFEETIGSTKTGAAKPEFVDGVLKWTRVR